MGLHVSLTRFIFPSCCSILVTRTVAQYSLWESLKFHNSPVGSDACYLQIPRSRGWVFISSMSRFAMTDEPSGLWLFQERSLSSWTVEKIGGA